MPGPPAQATNTSRSCVPQDQPPRRATSLAPLFTQRLERNTNETRPRPARGSVAGRELPAEATGHD
eukprot:10734184-Alexandrium_andersonii.AAC.1